MVHLAMLGVAGGALMWFNRNQWFFGDEWDFIAQRGFSNADFGLFEAHNEHWSTLPILVYRLLLNVVGLHHYWPYVAIVVLLHLCVTHLLWRQLVAMRVRTELALIGAAVFALLGAGAENLLWAFQIGFIGSVAFGWLAVLLVNTQAISRSRHLAAWAAAVAALMCSGIGVVMVGVAALTVLLRSGLRNAVLHASVPGAAFIIWYSLFGDAAAEDQGRPSAIALLMYVAVGLANALGQGVGWRGLGPLLVCALLVAGWRLRHEARGPQAAAFAGLVGSLFHYLIAAVGRADLGISQATVSRYVYIGLALMLPMLVLAVDRASAAGPRPLRVATCILMLISLAANVRQLHSAAIAEAAKEQGVRAVILETVNVLQSADTPLLRSLPEPLYSPNLTVDGVRRLQEDGWLPAPLADPVAALTVRANLQSAVAQPKAAIAPAAEVIAAVRASAAAIGSRCTVYTPTELDSPQIVVRTSGGGGGLVVTPSTRGNLLVFMSDDERQLVGSAAVYTLTSREAVALNLATAPGQSAIVSLPPGPTEVCLPTADPDA
jgi:hypothetical protein